MVEKKGDCPRCGRKNVRMTKGVCHNRCYRKFLWPRKKKICPRCKRKIFLKAKGLCGGCYNSVYRLEETKAHNCKRVHNIKMRLYKEITSKCVICGFEKAVDLHHLDNNRKNNGKNNLIGLCPNHHKMLHTLKYKGEIYKLLRQKGFEPKEKRPNEKIKGSF